MLSEIHFSLPRTHTRRREHQNSFLNHVKLFKFTRLLSIFITLVCNVSIAIHVWIFFIYIFLNEMNDKKVEIVGAT